MKTVLKIVASLVLAMSSASCIYEYPEPDFVREGEAATGGKVTLMMDVRTIRTRAGGTDTKQDLKRPFEKPRYLRVVIVGTDWRVSEAGEAGSEPGRTETPWKVEVNYRISEDMALGGDVMDAAGKQLKFPNIEAARKKRIYVFINCEDIEFTLSDGTTCSLNDPDAAEKLFCDGKLPRDGAGGLIPLDREAEHPYQTGRLPIDDCTYTFSKAKGLPYVGVYEVDVPPSDYVLKHYGVNDPESAFIEPLFSVGPLYLVRAANRIRFEFVNDTAHADGPGETDLAPVDIDVLGWTLSNTAVRAYLMPHLEPRTYNGNGWSYNGWARGWTNGGQNALTIPTQYMDSYEKTKSAGDYYGGAWMLWLKDEAERTQTNDYNGDALDSKYEWLTGYEVPAGTEPLEHSYGAPIPVPAPTKREDGTYGETSVLVPNDVGDENAVYKDAVYFAESKNSPDTDGRQHYWLEVSVRQTNTSDDVTPVYKTYTCEDLPNCLSLFRDTDLLVRVRFRRLRTDGLEMAVDVVPYGSIELDPVFGLEDK